ncbi:choice-of-anchor D domain-containing protein [Patescibacteria group bacterium]|nr:choice-of-anchor D domain-containing protein [Patescibacteria group bacterium]MBU1683125.1 choice-of-anchor D domain-containing protein [Patescibacteria group bacterium]MBU1934587.1 choice-of-anchor D domain-containing protein [Patescibacteria group bacterium]
MLNLKICRRYLASIVIIGLILSVFPFGTELAYAKADYSWTITKSSLSGSTKDGTKTHVYFEVKNTGKKTFDYYMTDHGNTWMETYRDGDNKNASNWMELKPGNTHKFRVALDGRDRAAPGTHRDTLTVKRKQGNKTYNIPVTFTVIAKKPEASYPNSASINETVRAGEKDKTNYFKIKNSGDDTLVYQLYTTPRADWLSYRRPDKNLVKSYKYYLEPGNSHTIYADLDASGITNNADLRTDMKIVTNDGTKLIGAQMHVRLPSDENALKKQKLIKLEAKSDDPRDWIMRPDNKLSLILEIRNTGGSTWVNNSDVKYGIRHVDGVNWTPRSEYYVNSAKKTSDLWIVKLPMIIPGSTDPSSYTTKWRMFREVNGVKTDFGLTFEQEIETDPYKNAVSTTLKRLRHEVTGDYLYTNNPTEVDSAILNGYTFEAVMGNVSAEKFDGSTEIHRLYKDNHHYYTDEYGEYDALVKSGWRNEGSYWLHKANSNQYDVHRIYSFYNGAGRHLISSNSGGEGDFKQHKNDLGYIVKNTTEPADIALSAESIDFGTIFKGETYTETFRIENTGQQMLSGNISPDGQFGVTPTSYSLIYNQPNHNKKENVEVKITPNSTGNFSGKIKITSNDPDAGEKTKWVTVKAKVVEKPTQQELNEIIDYANTGKTPSDNVKKIIEDLSDKPYAENFELRDWVLDFIISIGWYKVSDNEYFDPVASGIWYDGALALNALGYDTAAYLLKRSISTSNPISFSSGSSSNMDKRIVSQIRSTSFYRNLISQIALKLGAGVYDNFTGSGGSTFSSGDNTDLYLGIFNFSYSYTVKRIGARTYSVSFIISDTYDFKRERYDSFVNWANNAADLSQATNVLNEYGIKIYINDLISI